MAVPLTRAWVTLHVSRQHEQYLYDNSSVAHQERHRGAGVEDVAQCLGKGGTNSCCPHMLLLPWSTTVCQCNHFHFYSDLRYGVQY